MMSNESSWSFSVLCAENWLGNALNAFVLAFLLFALFSGVFQCSSPTSSMDTGAAYVQEQEEFFSSCTLLAKGK